MEKNNRYRLWLVFLLFLVRGKASAQYPQYFTYDDENGLPSNEVYSLALDPKGFVWMGGDAGLFKYDGIRYTGYKSSAQKSKSITGICFSSSGKLYCYNFQSQLFFIENDSLKELEHHFSSVSGITTDSSGNVFVNHGQGLSAYNEQKHQWTTYSDFGEETPYGNRLYTKSARVNQHQQVLFLTTSGVGLIEHNKLQVFHSPVFAADPPGNYIMECKGNEAWIFSAIKNVVYLFKDGNLQKTGRPGLQAAILHRKITNVRSLKDGKLWICTYKGMVAYDPETDLAQVYYPGFSFSDVLIDREGNYWMSTLQAGLLRIPDLHYSVWNKTSENMPGEKLSRVAQYEQDVFFATVNGYVGRLNTLTGEIKTFHTGTDADVQCLVSDAETGEVYFSVNNSLYVLKKDVLRLLQSNLPPVKSVLKKEGAYFLATSFGTYVHTFDQEKIAQPISSIWSRDLVYDPLHQLWAATNKGLLRFVKNKDQWTCTDTVLEQTQVLSLDLDAAQNILYALAFDGKIYTVSLNGKTSFLDQVLPGVQVYRLERYKGLLYLATNKGTGIYHLQNKKWEWLNKMDGLASDNVQDLQVQEGKLWLATGKGLQCLRSPYQHQRAQPQVYLKKIMADELLITDPGQIALNDGQVLYLQPESNAYSSNGNFRYAYRTKQDRDWNYFPGNVEVMAIPNIPAGAFEIELMLVDHRGRASANTILLSGHVKAPFWQRTWFILLCFLLVAMLAWIFFKRRIKVLRKKQEQEIARLNLEHELRQAQQTAIRAQMNPHFIFNVLNSIKGYIYKNDKQHASGYLSDFSDLVRSTLDRSSQQYTSLHDELKLLRLYLELEAMMLPDDFSYSLEVDENIDEHQVKVPSLILQPYIENAFKHGLRHKKGNKQLNIRIAGHPGETLSIEITDNGIGRKAAAEISSQQSPGHQSFATHAIEKRLDLINREGRQQIQVKIVDLHDHGEEGTRVIIEIQLHE